MRAFAKFLFITKMAVLLAGCGENGIKVECCRGIPPSNVPMRMSEKRWNSPYYYSPVFDEYNKIERIEDLTNE